jgi:hypothetical protein
MEIGCEACQYSSIEQWMDFISMSLWQPLLFVGLTDVRLSSLSSIANDRRFGNRRADIATLCRFSAIFQEISGLTIEELADSLQRGETDALDFSLLKKGKILLGDPDDCCEIL